MFRPLRRKDKELSLEEISNVLVNEKRGVIAFNGDDNYPYAIPINYFYDNNNNKIYFHGSRIGYKVDLLKKCNKVCFTVYGNIKTKEENWAPYIQSVVIFGKCKLIDDNSMAIDLLRHFANKYYPNPELVEKEIVKSAKAVQMYEIDIEYLTGKQIQEK